MKLQEMTREEKAASARNLLTDPFLTGVLEDMQNSLVQELLGTPVGSLTAQELHASMKSLLRFKAELKRYVDDVKMRS